MSSAGLRQAGLAEVRGWNFLGVIGQLGDSIHEGGTSTHTHTHTWKAVLNICVFGTFCCYSIAPYFKLQRCARFCQRRKLLCTAITSAYILFLATPCRY